MNYFHPDAAKDFLKAKVYGQPYMPRDTSELLFLLRIQARSWLLFVVSQFKLKYSSDPVWGPTFLLRDSVFIYVVYLYLCKAQRHVCGYGIIGTLGAIKTQILRTTFSIVLILPGVKSKVDKELQKTVAKIEEMVILNDQELLQLPQLPQNGLPDARVLVELDKLQTLKHSDWSNGRVSGAVYHGGSELMSLQSDAYRKYSIANQLHPDVFPGVRKMEAEVVAMVLKMFNGPETSCGSTTSGGTESLLLAGLAAREFGKRAKGITSPEVIAPMTIHAGIEKACYYFGMKLHKVDLDPVTYQVNLKSVKRHINSNTVLLVGSAPNYPHGIIDDIEGLSKLALKYNIPLHVDACLGSFIVSFLEKARVHEKVPLFDFRVPGVTSISCDTHKYGFAPKGSSIIMYRTNELRKCQYYVSSEWTGGMYGSPTLAGSRPGALVVGCWATLASIGEDGYTQFCKDIVGAMLRVKRAVKDNQTLKENLVVIGNPLASVVAFKARNKNFSIYKLGDMLTSKGWHFATLQHPAALHFAMTRLTIPIIDELINDLTECTKLTAEDESSAESDTAALYGVAGSVQTVGVADKIIEAFLDAMYKL
ncbi:dihydrosphingosine-1-phosphate lyase [Yamadazyma tenuis ATCC 10573]|uniref:sphinganine-1-phosphate aldolase n=1 Tax=Candida tenuis (strain ATCC 10573 / BCRC 21748 / CBS 615 / JCM 9827 / NBRC 10315 / NRRL Y-1498 / VKM Y-70) TaxID=590646 RepID=G3BF98_CANTC|nr:dihydrosphingosine-1-phosphate lyase [Yamadazyma tenuis ATCC 10573]EGV60005.1 dihydrosphingosine-1-phosphate lyase [Yamadazyma tenuis ATCC 10573]